MTQESLSVTIAKELATIHYGNKRKLFGPDRADWNMFFTITERVISANLAAAGTPYSAQNNVAILVNKLKALIIKYRNFQGQTPLGNYIENEIRKWEATAPPYTVELEIERLKGIIKVLHYYIPDPKLSWEEYKQRNNL